MKMISDVSVAVDDYPKAPAEGVDLRFDVWAMMKHRPIPPGKGTFQGEMHGIASGNGTSGLSSSDSGVATMSDDSFHFRR